MRGMPAPVCAIGEHLAHPAEAALRFHLTTVILGQVAPAGQAGPEDGAPVFMPHAGLPRPGAAQTTSRDAFRVQDIAKELKVARCRERALLIPKGDDADPLWGHRAEVT